MRMAPSENALMVDTMRGSSRLAPSSLILSKRGSDSPSAFLISSRVEERSFLSMSSQSLS